MTKIGDVSFWYADIGLPAHRRPALDGDTTADVAIIGAGYTGLWTAYYLKKAQPNLDVLVIEKDFAGFGASGRNGGWLMGTFAWNHDRYAAATSRAAVLDMVAALETTVDEVVRVCEAEGIDADIRRVDELCVATHPAHMARLRDTLADHQMWGEGHRAREITPRRKPVTPEHPRHAGGAGHVGHGPRSAGKTGAWPGRCGRTDGRAHCRGHSRHAV